LKIRQSHFKTLSLDELRSPDFNLLSDQEYSEEEITKTMAETMEQYMSKTRVDYGSEKMEEINNFQQEPDENLYQAWERFKELLMKCPQHYLTEMQELDANNTKDTKDCPPKEEGKNLKEAYYMQIGGPFQGGGYKAAAPGFYQRNNANPSYQERRKSMEDTLNKFISESAKRRKENSNLIKEFQASMDAAVRNQGASIKTLEIKIKNLRKVLQKRGFESLPSSTEVNLRDQVKSNSTPYPLDKIVHSSYSEASQSIPQKEKDPVSFTLPCFINNVCFDNALVDLGASVSVMPLLTYLNLGLGKLAHTRLTIKLIDKTMKYLKGIVENVLVRIGKLVFLVDLIILDMPKDIKVPLIIRRPFLSTTRAKINVYKRKITLRVGEEKVVFTSVKPASSLIKRVYMLSLRERIELDLEYRIVGETLVLNRSLDHFFEDHIELNDLNEPIELRRNQCNDLMPTIKEGEDKMEYKGNNVVRTLMNVPIFVGTFSVVTDFAVLENMDAYRDEGTSDIVVGKPLSREVGIKARRFEGTITLYKDDKSVTYQMVRLHPRFKRHANEQCNKIPLRLKVIDEDKKNGISHPYQKLKGFYKGVLILEADYILDAKKEEWLTRGHISMHEMEW
nr:hypothetical protein [Tanacetum cinerariifolium]